MRKNVINTTVTNGAMAINDHTNKPMNIIGYCVLKNGNVGALLDTNKYYSINELYIKDYLPHISTRSITGTVSPDMDMSTEDGIALFNSTLTFDDLHIEYVVLFKTPSQIRKGE